MGKFSRVGISYVSLKVLDEAVGLQFEINA